MLKICVCSGIHDILTWLIYHGKNVAPLCLLYRTIFLIPGKYKLYVIVPI